MTDPSRPLRVLHVTWRLSQTGGIPGVIRALIEHNQPARCEVHVATVRPAFAEDRLEELAGRAVLHPLGHEGPLDLVGRMRLMSTLARLQRTLRADVIHAHSGTATIALGAAIARRGTARAVDVHDAPGRGRHGPLTERAEGVLVRRAGFVPIVHSTSVRDDVVTTSRIPAHRPILVPLGIETAEFREAAATPDTDGRPVVLYVARAVPSKNVDLFLDLAAEVGPRARFVVVGDGSELVRLRRRVRDEGMAAFVELTGPVGGPIAPWYRRAVLFVSTSDYEGFGLAVVEAMAAATPVVATAVGGVTDLVVDGETGWLVPKGDLASLRARVLELLDDPATASRMGARATELACERFDVRRMSAAYLDAYEEIVRRSEA